LAKVLVCRCEDVTLHELEDAIARGHDDIESLKRYTGFGTGWCQGKGCVALCARLLRERGGDATLPFTPRPPFHPLPLSALAGLAEIAEQDAREGRPIDGADPHRGKG
jgi:bacterioferritin-associated ferredoxin